jgi:hypothetical protein
MALASAVLPEPLEPVNQSSTTSASQRLAGDEPRLIGSRHQPYVDEIPPFIPKERPLAGGGLPPLVDKRYQEGAKHCVDYQRALRSPPMRGSASVTQVTSATAVWSPPRSETPEMDQSSPPRGSPAEASWPRVLWNTFALWLRRRRIFNRDADELIGPRTGVVLIAALFAVVVIGGLAYLVNPFGLSGGSADSTESTDASGVQEPRAARERETTRDQAPTSPSVATAAPREASPESAHAAAGAEIASRSDIRVSGDAAALLRSGAVDGRVLIVMAALASGNRLHTIDVPPSDSPTATTSTDLELGVIEVDSVLQWLDSQIVLRPDRLEVRREASRSYVRLIYSSPEPPGLFPS